MSTAVLPEKVQELPPAKPQPVSPAPAKQTRPEQKPVAIYAGDRVAVWFWLGCALLIAGMLGYDLVVSLVRLFF